MLKFLGFIALIAIIFGVSLTSALTGFLKVVAIGLAIIMGFIVVAKMLESKTGSWLALAGGAIAMYLGVLGINTDRTLTLEACRPLAGEPSFTYCLSSGTESANKKINQGWGYAICGGLVVVASCASLGSREESAKSNEIKKS